MSCAAKTFSKLLLSSRLREAIAGRNDEVASWPAGRAETRCRSRPMSITNFSPKLKMKKMSAVGDGETFRRRYRSGDGDFEVEAAAHEIPGVKLGRLHYSKDHFTLCQRGIDFPNTERIKTRTNRLKLIPEEEESADFSLRVT